MSKERLVELLWERLCGGDRKWAYEIADYLIANGVIVPPCKVGDKVFVICNDEVQETSVFSMTIDISDVVSVYYIYAYAVDGTEKEKDGYYTPYVMSFRFGFSAFSSREEAKQALEGRK